ncbi:hypothetical protein WG936_06695 [Corynebacterium sp. H127]|uniref:hypothetical protein n=1 Tax=Corynebacterium sp. H127 TaxID=3133418 RepID=UPI00309B6CF0
MVTAIFFFWQISDVVTDWSATVLLVWRVGVSVLGITTILGITLFFRRCFPIAAWVVFGLAMLGQLLFVQESIALGQVISESGAAPIVGRYSQCVLPLAMLVLAWILFRDRRFPLLLGWFFVAYSVAWFGCYLFQGEIGNRVWFSFLSDLLGMFAHGGLVLWMTYLGWSRAIPDTGVAVGETDVEPRDLGELQPLS